MRSSLRLFQKFCTNEFDYTTKNIKTLHESLDEKDKKLFKFDIKSIDWLVFLKNYVLGVRTYLIKEDDSTIPAARKHQIK